MKQKRQFTAWIGLVAVSIMLFSGCTSPVGGSGEGGGSGSGGGGSVSTVDTPVITPASGTFFQSVDFEISSAWPGAQIYYTLDGSDPVIGSNYYSGLAAVQLGPGTTTVRARAWDSAGEAETSAIAEATFTVNAGIVVTNGNSSGAGSLAQALSDAEDGTEIRFDGDYTITVPEMGHGNPGAIDGFRIADNVIINGVGYDVALVGRENQRIATIDGATEVTLRNLTLRDGEQNSQGADTGGAIIVPTGARLTVQNVSFLNNLAGRNGGAIWLQSDTEAVIEDSVFRSNDVGSQGGAIYVGNTSELTVRNTTFAENSTEGALAGTGTLNGGAIAFANSGTGMIESSSFEENESEQWAGAISITGGSSVDIVDTDFLLNKAGLIPDNSGNYGGGAINIGSNSTARIAGSYFERNTALLNGYRNRNGGAIRNQGTLLSYGNTFNGNLAGDEGAAIYAGSNAESLTVSSSSFAGNDISNAGGSGGAIYAEADTNVIQYSSFAYNGGAGGVGGVYVPDTSTTAELHYSAFRFGEINPTTFDSITSVVTENTIAHPGITSEDPEFTLMPDPGNDSSFGQANDSYGDLRPDTGSPLLGSGDPSILLEDVLDVDGDGNVVEPEPFDASGAARVINTMEIGAYEVAE